MEESKQLINSFLKNLFFYVHQNFLIVIQIMLSRMPTKGKASNLWASTLQKILNEKLMKKLVNKGEVT